jgi:hypothetical protein
VQLSHEPVWNPRCIHPFRRLTARSRSLPVGECKGEMSMKKKLLYLFVLVGAVLVGAERKAQAQIVGDVNANIPFQFHAGGAELPAGNYTIRVVSTSNDNTMEIQSADGRKSALFETENTQTNATPKNSELIFDHVGDNYFLSQIVDAEDDYGAEVINPGYSKKQEAAAGASGQKHVSASHPTP